jgi:SAM-dependent methyltransferase
VVGKIDGFPAYAPDLAVEAAGFKAEYFAVLVDLEAKNFWFRARNDLVLWALRTHFPAMRSFLEIGCGTGFVLSAIARSFPEIALCGSELLCAGLGFAAERAAGAELIQMDARRIPFVEEFDVVGGFDCLEHIEEDEVVLAQIHQAIRPGGGLVLTVPQHPWLWSPMDEHACHVRRYTRQDLADKIRRAGFQILLSTSFVSLLLPAMLASRWLQPKDRKEFDPEREMRIPVVLNAVFEAVLRLELGLIRAGVSFPLGGSRLVVARRI